MSFNFSRNLFSKNSCLAIFRIKFQQIFFSQLDLNEANKKLQSAQAAAQQNNVAKPVDDAQRKQIEAQLKQMEEVKKQLDGQAKAIESERKLFEEQRFVVWLDCIVFLAAFFVHTGKRLRLREKTSKTRRRNWSKWTGSCRREKNKWTN